MLDEIYQHIDRPIDRGEEVGGVGDVLYPQWPVHLLLLQPGDFQRDTEVVVAGGSISKVHHFKLLHR